MNNNIEKIYKIYYRKLDKIGFINLNHIQVDTKDRIVALSKILRNHLYETFRIIYMNGKYIVGEEIIGVKRPVDEVKFYTDTFSRIKSQINIEKIEKRMKSINSDSYYLIHNHKSDKLRVSKEEILLTKCYFKKLSGFKGHLIINSNSFLWIDYIDNELIVSKEKFIKFNRKRKRSEKVNIKIYNKDQIATLIGNYINLGDYSICIVSKFNYAPELIFEIPNDLIKNKCKELNKYLYNNSKINNDTNIFLITKDKVTFDTSRKLVNGKIIDYSCLIK